MSKRRLDYSYVVYVLVEVHVCQSNLNNNPFNTSLLSSFLFPTKLHFLALETTTTKIVEFCYSRLRRMCIPKKTRASSF